MDWRKNGVKIVHAGELDMNQASGMTRAAAITTCESRSGHVVGRDHGRPT